MSSGTAAPPPDAFAAEEGFELGRGCIVVAFGGPHSQRPRLGEDPGRGIADDPAPVRRGVERGVRRWIVATVRGEVAKLGVIPSEEEAALELLGDVA